MPRSLPNVQQRTYQGQGAPPSARSSPESAQKEQQFHNMPLWLTRPFAPGPVVTGFGVFSGQSAQEAAEIASPRNRSTMLRMALVWLRLAEYAAKTAAAKECTEFISPASVDGERTQHIG